VRVAFARAHAKRVSKDVVEARKSKGLCLRCGNAGYRIRECTYLPPTRPEVRVFAARSNGSIGLNRSHKTRVTASRVRQIKEVLDELNSSDFDD
jgi:adenine-specific DNA methylase